MKGTSHHDAPGKALVIYWKKKKLKKNSRYKILSPVVFPHAIIWLECNATCNSNRFLSILLIKWQYSIEPSYYWSKSRNNLLFKLLLQKSRKRTAVCWFIAASLTAEFELLNDSEAPARNESSDKNRVWNLCNKMHQDRRKELNNLNMLNNSVSEQTRLIRIMKRTILALNAWTLKVQMIN